LHYWKRTPKDKFLQETAIDLPEGGLTPLHAITLFFHGITLRDEFHQETAIAPLVVSPNPLLAIMQFLIVILQETDVNVL